jgi:hypothetical protein
VVKDLIREAREEIGVILRTIIHGAIQEMEVTQEATLEWEAVWEVECTVSRHGTRTHSINKANPGAQAGTSRCRNGKTSSIATFLRFNSREDVISVMVVAQLIITECRFLVEYVIVIMVFALNAMVEE